MRKREEIGVDGTGLTRNSLVFCSLWIRRDGSIGLLCTGVFC